MQPRPQIPETMEEGKYEQFTVNTEFLNVTVSPCQRRVTAQNFADVMQIFDICTCKLENLRYFWIEMDFLSIITQFMIK